MKVKVVTGATIYESAKNVIKSIDKQDLNTPYFIVVPDRFTLQAEKMLFDTLEISSTFNINVVGLSSLASKTFVEENEKRFTALDGLILIKKILTEKKNELKYFKKDNSTLCEEIFKTIQQIKSSSLKPTDITFKNARPNLANKLHDIKLIFEQYEIETNGRLDDNDYFEEFALKIERDKLFADSVFIFAGFDSFTATNLLILKALSKTVKEIRFALPKSESLTNAYIYEGDILNKLKKLANENGLEIEVDSPILDVNKERAELIKNLFGFGDNKGEKGDFLFVANSNTMKEEVSFVAKSIKKAVYDGARFNDFMIICSDLESYANDIKTVFQNYKINAYIDISEKLSHTLIARTVKSIFDLSRKGFLKEDLLNVLSSQLIEIEDRENLIAFVNEKNIAGKYKTSKYLLEKAGILNIAFSIKEKDSYESYADIIKETLSLLKDKHNDFVEKEEQANLIQEASFEKQAFTFMEEVSESIKSIKGGVSLKDFLSIFLTALDGKEISSLPSFCDQVFIGDASSSFFSKTKFVFVLGANAGKMPRNSNDDGLFSDNEIMSSCFARVLEPTIRMINKRNRFKLFSAIAQAEERLVVSYLNFNEEGQKQERAQCVQSLMNIFNYSEKEIISTNAIMPKNLDSLKFCLGTESESKKFLINLKGLNNKYYPALQLQFLKESGVRNNKISVDLAQKTMLKDGSIKVTQIEAFYDCPFKHFVSYALKPVIKQKAEIKPNQIGTIMHNLLEAFVSKFANRLSQLSTKEIEEFLQGNIKKFIKQDDVEFIENREIFEKEICLNAKTLCERVVYESKFSKFKPTYLEKRINNLRLDNVRVSGIVDRVDVYEDGFRIIDYKTGSIKESVLSSLYYGKKLQLFLYGKAIEEELGLNFKGAFYFDAKVSYSSNNPTILKGIYQPTQKNIFDMDSRLEDDLLCSDIVSAGKKKNGDFNSATLSQPELKKLTTYSAEIAEKSVKQIKEGKIDPSPCQNSCKYCEYKAICLYDTKKGVRALKSMDGYFKEATDE